jgi:hypothetical protein
MDAREKASTRTRRRFGRDDDEKENFDVGPGARIEAWLELRHASLGRRAKQTSLRRPNHDDFRNLKVAWREKRAISRMLGAGDSPTGPATPPATNWVPIGPSVIRRSQTTGSPAVSGRAVDIAVVSGGTRVYVATANGGAWRSDDSGATWKPLMDSVALAPTFVDADSLACGAILVDPNNQDRVFVGTGEGDASYFFNGVFGVVYSYGGVGVLRNDTAGDGAWINEPIAPGSPSLNGKAFFALAIDPTDAQRLVGATTGGIYRREPDGSGGHYWRQTRTGSCTSVVVARSGGTTAWYAAMRGGPILTSADGATWTTLGTGFPSATRITLSVQPTNTGTVYAFSSAGIHRLEVADGTWRLVSTAVTVDGGEYGAALVVDPGNVNRLYIGAYGGGNEVRRGIVSSTGSGSSLTYSMALTYIGTGVHADLHRLVLRPDDANELWAACDGGVFRTSSASGTTTWVARNTGLATVLCVALAHHPTEPAVVFSGVQDNGTVRYTGEEAWLASAPGDGGHCVVNWNDPYKVIVSYVYGTLRRATDGGAGLGSWTIVSPPSSGALFYPPVAGAPPSPTAAEAERVAMGADRTWFSDDFGSNWSSPDAAGLAGTVNSLVYASGTRVYAGTTNRQVYRYDRSSTAWGAGSLIGQVGGASATNLAPIVTSIAVDPADSTGASFYVTLGGAGDWRRIWHYDGTNWANRSGPSAGAATSLLPVHFNAIVVDPANTSHLYAAADIGVWRSTNSGADWAAYADGLPEAGVTDLLLHPGRRLLRAAMYGRGTYEREIDATSAAGIELYARDTSLDVARWPTVDWLADPEVGTTPHPGVMHWESPNLKVDPPASSGTYQTTQQIDFFQFADQLVDGGETVATVDASVGTAVNRVFVEVHNRGVLTADGVRVVLLMADASAGLSATPLPAGYATNVQTGTSISGGGWQTVGIKPVDGLRVGVPKIVEFDLPSSILPPPSGLAGHSHYCLLALLHHPSDAFTATEPNADNLTIAERKVAQKNIHIVAFTGTLPPPGAPVSPLRDQTALIQLFGGPRSQLILDTRRATGSVSIVLPRWLDTEVVSKRIVGGEVLGAGKLDDYATGHLRVARQSIRASRSAVPRAASALRAVQACLGGTAIRFDLDGRRSYVGIRGIDFERPVPALLVFHPPAEANVGDRWDVPVMIGAPGGTITGGSTYRCQVVLPPDDDRWIQIEASAQASAGRLRLAARLATRGRALLKGKHRTAEVQAVAFTAVGATAPVELTWDAEAGEFVADLDGAPDNRPIRRVTLVARVGRREGRRTIDAPTYVRSQRRTDGETES